MIKNDLLYQLVFLYSANKLWSRKICIARLKHFKADIEVEEIAHVENNYCW